MEKTAEQFWADFEAETGEKVEARAMGTYREPGDRGEGVWGLVVLTDRSLRFRFMPKQARLMSLFAKQREPESVSVPVDIVAPRADVASISIPKRGFFARVFGPAYPPFEVEWREGGETKRACLSADPSTGLYEALATAFPAAEPPTR
jgi:hypothetical protein